MSRFRIVIEGMADPLFLPGLLKDALNITPDDGSIVIRIGGMECDDDE
jgi:hypothetical protein